MVLTLFLLINHPRATRKTRKKNANSVYNENISLKHSICENEAKSNEGQVECRQALG